MTIRTQVLVLILLVVLLLIIINMVKKRQLELKYVLVWLFCDIVLILFTCFPQLMNNLADLLGIYSPMNMIFFLGFVLALVIIFSLTIALSKVTVEVRRIAQVVAILSDEKKKESDESMEKNEKL